jgi:hypothetical protein
MLSEENDIILEKTLTYPLGPVPWALATADDLQTKTDKAKLMDDLEGDYTMNRPGNKNIIYIYLQALSNYCLPTTL